MDNIQQKKSKQKVHPRALNIERWLLNIKNTLSEILMNDQHTQTSLLLNKVTEL